MDVGTNVYAYVSTNIHAHTYIDTGAHCGLRFDRTHRSVRFAQRAQFALHSLRTDSRRRERKAAAEEAPCEPAVLSCVSCVLLHLYADVLAQICRWPSEYMSTICMMFV